MHQPGRKIARNTFAVFINPDWKQVCSVGGLLLLTRKGTVARIFVCEIHSRDSRRALLTFINNTKQIIVEGLFTSGADKGGVDLFDGRQEQLQL
jgi:hypothetical protein